MKAHTIEGALKGQTITKSEVENILSKPYRERGTTAICTGCSAFCLVSLYKEANVLPMKCLYDVKKDGVPIHNWLEVVDDEQEVSE